MFDAAKSLTSRSVRVIADLSELNILLDISSTLLFWILGVLPENSSISIWNEKSNKI